MKIHSLVEGSTRYPVGELIMQNMPVIISMGNSIIQVLRKNYKSKKDVHLICRGSSGAIIAAIVGNMIFEAGYKIQIYHVKKEGESSHNGNGSFSEYIFTNDVTIVVDDFIASGNTIESICEIFENIIDKFSILCVSGTIPKDTQRTNKFIHGIQTK